MERVADGRGENRAIGRGKMIICVINNAHV